MKKVHWGSRGNNEVFLFTLKAERIEAIVSNYGATLQSLNLVGKTNSTVRTVLGYDTLDEYVRDPYHMGSIAGRYAGRIRDGRVVLDGRTHSLTRNWNGHHLHGGAMGFNKKVFDLQGMASDRQVTFTYRSADGEEGYPGNLDVRVTYLVTDACELVIFLEAVTDKTTIVNMAPHAYFNLGPHAETIMNHRLQLNASRFLPIDEFLLPTGAYRSVGNTVFDFQKPKTIGTNFHSPDSQLLLANGYDHTWILDDDSTALKHAATASYNGITLNLFTSEPGIHLYTGNFLPNNRDAMHHQHSGFCLETMHFPDSPNQPHFPTTVLTPGNVFRSETRYRFAIGN